MIDRCGSGRSRCSRRGFGRSDVVGQSTAHKTITSSICSFKVCPWDSLYEHCLTLKLRSPAVDLKQLKQPHVLHIYCY